jgi:putative serine/threonine protein kinase
MRSFQQSDILSNKIDIDSYELANIISYPKFDNIEYNDRLNEIFLLGINFAIHGGRTKIGKVAIAGKGCVSVVIKIQAENKKICALKIRRTDTNRMSMDREAALHKIANSVGIGPEIIRHSKNLIVMEFVEGSSIINWIKQDQNIADPDKVRSVIVNVLEQCYVLDRACLDHGQLSCLHHHVIISKSKTANIIDFESSSTERRRVSNVTCAAQSLLLSGLISKRINKVLDLENKRENIIQKLKAYKSYQTRVNFDKILDMLIDSTFP